MKLREGMLCAIAVGVCTAMGSASAQPGAATAEIDHFIINQLDQRAVADVFIKMNTDARHPDYMALPRGGNRAQLAYERARDHMEASQGDIRAFLRSRGYEFETFWINNSILVRDAGPRLVNALAARADVAYLKGNTMVELHVPQAGTDEYVRGGTVEWGIDRVNAPAVWATGNTGQGVVVANIDTGVRYTHQAVVEQYRGNDGGGSFTHDYNWFDPAGIFPDIPGDNNNHGTHTMGTMVGGDGEGPGTNDIGVAPGAEWIAAKGCESNSCSSASLIAAAQWIACPTRTDGTDADCSQIPDIVNNSWGGGGGDPWYTSYVVGWLQAGIIPVFSAGNNGTGCNSLGTPGDYRNVIGVGGTDINNSNYDFSSKGPGSFRPLKPDFAAPGENVRSATASNNGSYSSFSGTSMAAPHVAGTLALMISANPNASLGTLYGALRNTTQQNLLAPTGPDACGGRNFDVYPNFIYGWGQIDAAAAVQAVTP